MDLIALHNMHLSIQAEQDQNCEPKELSRSELLRLVEAYRKGEIPDHSYKPLYKSKGKPQCSVKGCNQSFDQHINPYLLDTIKKEVLKGTTGKGLTGCDRTIEPRGDISSVDGELRFGYKDDPKSW